MKNKILLSLCLIPFFLMLSAGLVLKHLSDPLLLETPVRIEVKFGDSIYSVADKLEKEGLLPYPKLWIWYGRLFDMAPKIKAGEYLFDSGTSRLFIMDDMVKGKVIHYKVTLIEGWTIKEAIEQLHKTDGIVKTLEPDDHVAILASVNADKRFTHPEGLFYPDTYHFAKGSKDSDILRSAHNRLIDSMQNVWEKADKEALPFKSDYEMLILASIIEKETAVESERRQIAGVFIERLNIGMRLQTDPTVIYGMGNGYDGNIRKKDLLTPTPYNTYTINGLPPTPIALTTQASMEAAIDPLLNGMLFFVGKGDGHHYFSKTLQEHEQAVRRYQLRPKRDYRSTPKKDV